MLEEPKNTIEVNDDDVATAIQSLASPEFKNRFVKTDCNVSDPDWKAGGQPIDVHVGGLMDRFKRDVEGVQLRDFHGGVFQKFDAATLLTIVNYKNFKPVIPAPQDLFHVYGPDKGQTKDWSKYYAYAWRQEGPHAIIYSDSKQIINEGKPACSSYSYSGQASFAIAGAGIFFQPLYGEAKVIIKPYVQWFTSASFTGATGIPASCTAHLGIFIESWKPGNPEKFLERDVFVPVWTQNTQGYIVGNSADGSVSMSDGLTTEIIAIPSRKYSIFVYAWVETSAGAQQLKNEHRFVRLDIDASIPYVVVEEKLL